MINENFVDSRKVGRSLTNLDGIPLAELAARFPVVTATQKHSSRTDRFSAIPTIEVLEKLSDNGFIVTEFNQAVARTTEKQLTGRHMFTMRHTDDLHVRTGVVNQIVGINALDGTAAFNFFAGVLRFACFNGLIAGDALGAFKTRHVGENKLENALHAVSQVAERFPMMRDRINEFSQIQVDHATQERMAQAAFEIRTTEKQRERMITKPSMQLGFRRRADDTGNDLWTVFNVIQENVMKGGQTNLIRGQNGFPRRSSFKQITNVADRVRINRALWDNVLEATAKELTAA